ncbi:unnamed protein product, partial [Durusdinium trenchii]
MIPGSRDDVLEPSVYDLARESARVEGSREGQEEEKQEEQTSKVDILAPYLVDFFNKDTGLVQLDSLQAELVAKKCTTDFRKRLTDRAEIIQRRLEEEQELLRKRRAQMQRRGDSVEKDEQAFAAYQDEAMFRTQILEQRLARHEMQAIEKFQELERMLQEDPRLAAMWQKEPAAVKGAMWLMGLRRLWATCWQSSMRVVVEQLRLQALKNRWLQPERVIFVEVWVGSDRLSGWVWAMPGVSLGAQCRSELTTRKKDEISIRGMRSVAAGKKRDLTMIPGSRDDVLEPSVYDLARESARVEGSREGQEEEKQEEQTSKDTGLVQLDSLQAELVAKKCTTDFRPMDTVLGGNAFHGCGWVGHADGIMKAFFGAANRRGKRLTDRAEIIQRRLEESWEEQELLRKRRAQMQRRGDSVEKDEQAFAARLGVATMVALKSYQDEAMFRTQILEQRLARHEMQAIEKFQAQKKIRWEGRGEGPVVCLRHGAWSAREEIARMIENGVPSNEILEAIRSGSEGDQPLEIQGEAEEADDPVAKSLSEERPPLSSEAAPPSWIAEKRAEKPTKVPAASEGSSSAASTPHLSTDRSSRDTPTWATGAALSPLGFTKKAVSPVPQIPQLQVKEEEHEEPPKPSAVMPEEDPGKIDRGAVIQTLEGQELDTMRQPDWATVETLEEEQRMPETSREGSGAEAMRRAIVCAEDRQGERRISGDCAVPVTELPYYKDHPIEHVETSPNAVEWGPDSDDSEGDPAITDLEMHHTFVQLSSGAGKIHKPAARDEHMPSQQPEGHPDLGKERPSNHKGGGDDKKGVKRSRTPERPRKEKP